MLKKLFKFACFFVLTFNTNIYAQDTNNTSVFDIIDITPASRGDQKNIAQEITQIINDSNLDFKPTDEENIPESQLYKKIQPKKLHIRATKIPDSVYVGQIFSFNVLADTQSDLSLNFETSIQDSSLAWLNKNNLKWSHNGGGMYSTTLYFQANDSKAKSLNLNLKVLLNGEIYQQDNLSVFLPQVKDISYEKSKYSHIVAENLEANSFRLKKFDENKTIIMIELHGKNVNLKSFKIDNPSLIHRQDIDTVVGGFANQSAYYFAVLNHIVKSFSFTYFDLTENRLKTIEKIGLKLENDDVSTQVDLNPQESYFEIYKNTAIFTLAVIFVILAFWRKRPIYFITAVFFIFVSAYVYNPLNIAILKDNSQVRILPIASSTPFYEQIGKVQKGVKILDAAGDYYKIKFSKDGRSQVGWVEKDDLTKN